MRFCPFCSAENASVATHCATCARRLPPLPPRKRGDPSTVQPPPAAPAPAPAPPPKEPSPISSVSLGPAALRRTKEPEAPRASDEPARRSGDRPAAAPAIAAATKPLPAPAPKLARPATADDFSEDAETQIDPKLTSAPAAPLPQV